MSVTGAQIFRPVAIDEYLTGELSSAVRHEYVAGRVYAMVGSRHVHQLIASNALAEIHLQLKGKSCRVLNSDSKVRVQSMSTTCFYYPDVSVVCGENILDGTFQDRPTVVIEVLSDATRRIDEGEKLLAYCSIPTLTACILFEPQTAAAVVHRRIENGFQPLVYAGLDSMIPLPEIGVHLGLASVYANVSFSSEAKLRQP